MSDLWTQHQKDWYEPTDPGSQQSKQSPVMACYQTGHAFPPNSFPNSLSDYEDISRYFTHAPFPTQGNLWSPSTDYHLASLDEISTPISTFASASSSFSIHSSSLYPPPNLTPPSITTTFEAQPSTPMATSEMHEPKESSTSFIGSRRSSLESSLEPEEFVPSKRSRVGTDVNTAGNKPSGACTRCKRLKMKCTFPDKYSTCARCIAGNHGCIVLGRKPRSPALRDILRKQIREKDAKIDELLAQLNPAPSLSTPLSVVTSRLPLTSAQRSTYHDVLLWFERTQNNPRGSVELKGKIDFSALEDGCQEEDDVAEDESREEEESTILSGSTQAPITSLPNESAPAGILASTSLESISRRPSRHSSPSSTRERSVGVVEMKDLKIEEGIGSTDYFRPGPSANLDLRRLIIERQAAPDILLCGLVAYEDVGLLFHIYYKWINPFIPVLDENIHTPAAVLGRCPFLFTVVCALSSRYYEEKPEMYSMAMHLAKAAAANAFLDGWKTIEMCQAYVLLGAYTPPARRWEEDRYWFYTGIAFRLSIELNLNRLPDVRPTDERNERELLNRIRTWLICYIMDRCICVNLGKSFMVPEDEVIRNAAVTFLGSRYQHPGDAYLVSLVELLRIMTRFADTVSPLLETRQGFDQDLDLMSLHKAIDNELSAWKNAATDRCNGESAPGGRNHTLQTALMYSVYQYSRLVTFSAGLRHVIRRGTLKEDAVFFSGCLNAASNVLSLMLDQLVPSGFLRYSPDQVFALSAFATAVLMKCLGSEFSWKMDRSQEAAVIDLVKRLLLKLDDDEHAVDEQHTSKRYARFLRHIFGGHLSEQETRLGHTEKGSGEASKSPPAFIDEQPLPARPATSSETPVPFDEFQGYSGLVPWGHAPSYNCNPGPIPPLFGFINSDYLAAMMSFPNQSWYTN